MTRPRSLSGPAHPPEGPRDGSTATRDLDQLRRLAELIVEGQAPFPGDLPLADRDRLAALVRAGLRNRLTDFIAWGIAADIAAAPAQQGGASC